MGKITTITVSQETKVLLEKAKEYPRETYESVILRLLAAHSPPVVHQAEAGQVSPGEEKGAQSQNANFSAPPSTNEAI